MPLREIMDGPEIRAISAHGKHSAILVNAAGFCDPIQRIARQNQTALRTSPVPIVCTTISITKSRKAVYGLKSLCGQFTSHRQADAGYQHAHKEQVFTAEFQLKQFVVIQPENLSKLIKPMGSLGCS